MADDLAREVVADPRWRWASGVRWRFDVPSHADIWSVYEGDDACDADGGPATETPPNKRGPVIIDLDDPATAGVIVGMLEKERPNVIISRASDGTWFANAGRVVDTSLGRAAARAWLAMGAS